MKKMMTPERAKNTAKERLSLSRRNSVCLTLCLLSLAFFASLSFPQPPDPSQIPEPQIAYALHAVWDPDLTDNNPPVCTTSDTVAVPSFHFYAGWKDGAPAFFSVDWVLIEELTSDHEPQVWLFGNLQGESGFPYCTMPPVSDPENWNWTTFSFAPMIGFALHNAPYRITVQWRYGVYMKGPRGPFQTSITIHVQNLVVTSPDVGRVLRWDPEKGIADTSFSYNIECAQKKQVSVRVRIYDMSGNVVYEVTEQKMCPGGYRFTWDGTMNTGYYGYPPEEGSNIAPSGLYAFDLEVEGAAPYYDSDRLRSNSLQVFMNYVWIEHELAVELQYILYSNRNAIFGEIRLYSPNLNLLNRWDIKYLNCQRHSLTLDGLVANMDGISHILLIPDAIDHMIEEGEGGYHFVIFFMDDYNDLYKNHKPKPSLPKSVNYYHYFIASIIEDDGIEVYFNWPWCLEDEFLIYQAQKEYEIPSGAIKCPKCDKKPYRGIGCNGIHCVRIPDVFHGDRILPCSLCNGLGYVSSSWPSRTKYPDFISTISPKPPRTRSRRATDDERRIVNELGEKYGCHSCGTKNPGTPNGQWIPDHLPPWWIYIGIVKTPLGIYLPNPRPPEMFLLPHCSTCKARQGGFMSRQRIWGIISKWRKEGRICSIPLPDH